MTRAQFAAAVARAFKLPSKRPASTFTDVPPSFWGAEAIGHADRMGFTSGFPDNTFRPNLNISRVQAIVSLISGLGLTGDSSSNLLTIYNDRAQVPSYATDKVAIATMRRIVVNHPNVKQLEPMREITRAEVAALIYQSLVATGQASAIDSPFIVNPSPATASFTDLQGHWATEFIRSLSNQGFISGFTDGTFRPNASMTRAQYSALLVKAFNPSPKRVVVSFPDVPADLWAKAAIEQAYRGGFLSGFSDQTFRPSQNILRVQVLSSLVSGLGIPRPDEKGLTFYADQSTIPPSARTVVAAAMRQRLVINYPTLQQLNPNREATRAEVAAIVYQALIYTGRSTAINSPYIVPSQG